MSDCTDCACSGGQAISVGCAGCGGTGIPLAATRPAPDVGVLAGDGCGATTRANGAVADVACSIGVDLQGIYDEVMHLKTELGFTPYRVFLVWEEQGEDGVYRDARRIELQPVAVKPLKDIKLELGPGGLQPQGEVMIEGVSPRQVTQDDLLGRLYGRPWSGDKQRFFFEVLPRDECPGRPEPTRWRFAPWSPPTLSRAKEPIGWSIKVSSQMPSRGRHGEDRTVELGEPAPTFSKWDGART